MKCLLKTWLLLVFGDICVGNVIDYVTLQAEKKTCLPVSVEILFTSLEFLETTQVVFAFNSNSNGRSQANCVASLLFKADLDLNVPFMFWEIFSHTPRKNSVLDQFQEMSAYSSVAIIPLGIPNNNLFEWIEFTKAEYRVFDWLWIGYEIRELKRLERLIRESGLGCKFNSLSPYDKKLCSHDKKPDYCRFSTDKKMVILKIAEVPVLQCKTERVVYAMWRYNENHESQLVYKASDRSLIANRKILIGTITMAPFMVLGNDSRGEIIPITGIDEGLIKAFAQYFNFKYSLRTPRNVLWGKPTKNGTWNGLVGLIQRQEIDYGFTALSITPEKQGVIDYSIPNFFDSVTFLTRKPRKLSAVYALVLPYTFDVWIYVFITLLLAPLIVHVVFKMIPVPERGIPFWGWSHAALYMFGAVTQHGSGTALPQPNSIRIIIGSFWLFSFVFFTGYAGTLVSFLNFPSTEEPVDTIAILLKNAKNGHFKVGTIADSQVLEILNVSDVKGIFKILKTEMEESRTEAVVADHEAGIELATHENFALISASSLMEATAAKMGMDRVLFAKDRFYFFQYGLGFPKGSLFRSIINVPLIEAGIMNKGWMDMVNKRKIQFGIRNGSEIFNEEDELSTEKTLRLKEIQGVFLVTSFAVATCFVAFFVETAWGVLDRQRNGNREILLELNNYKTKMKRKSEDKCVQCDIGRLRHKQVGKTKILPLRVKRSTTTNLST